VKNWEEKKIDPAEKKGHSSKNLRVDAEVHGGSRKRPWGDGCMKGRDSRGEPPSERTLEET